MSIQTLHPDHLADLKKSGLSDETIEAAAIYTVRPGDIGKVLGGNDAGVMSLLAFPYPGCEGFLRFKCWYQEDKTGPKYRQKTGTLNRLYLPPTVDIEGDSHLLVVEGEKKCLGCWQNGFDVLGIPGVWNWCMKAEGGYRQPKEIKPIPDLDRVNWRRPVIIIFDSDGHDNPLVRLAAFRLAREVAKRGAAASILFLPVGPNGEKVGADDFLVAHGAEKLREMMP